MDGSYLLLIFSWTLLPFEVSMARDCDISYNVTENGANFSIFRSTQTVCLRCVNNSTIFTDTSWMVPDQSGAVLVTVTNSITFNSSFVEVANGVLMIKDPASQLMDGPYIVNAFCSSSLSYQDIRLVLLATDPNCTEVNVVRENNTEFIIDATDMMWCLQCVNSVGQHDPSTLWSIFITDQLGTPSIDTTEFPDIVVQDGFILFPIPISYTMNTEEALLAICNGTDFTYGTRIYRRDMMLLPPTIGLGDTTRLKEGAFVSITCQNNNPPIFSDITTWTVNIDGGSVEVSSTNILSFNPVNRSDAAMYSCTLMRNGISAAVSIIITVDYVDAILPIIRTLYPVSSNFFLTCVYGGFMPDPETIFWNDLLGFVRNTSSSVNIVTDAQTTTLMVEIGPNSNFMNRRYTCLQIEESGSLTQEFFIYFFPLPVVGLAAPMLSSMSITLMWGFQPNPAEFRIETSIDVFNASDILVTNLTIGGSSTTTATFGTLLPFATYTFKVYAINLIGASRDTAITVITLSEVLSCNIIFLITQSDRSYAVNESVAVACLQCGNTNAEWMINYQGMVYRVTNTFSPNASIVEVIDGILEVKNPTDQLTEGFYEIDVICTPSFAYTDIRLYQLILPQFCDASYTTNMNNFEVLVDVNIGKLCLECVNSDGFHDPLTQWQILQGNGTLNSIITGGDIEVVHGFLSVADPYSRLVKNNFFTLCMGFEISLVYRIYSTDFIPPSIPSQEVTREGSNTAILCINTNPSLFGITPIWVDSNQLIASRTLVLRFNPVTRTDSGVFTCSLTTSDNQTKSSSVTLTVQFVDSTAPSRLVIFPTESILLACNYNFVPDESSVSWENGTTKLENGRDGVTVTISGRETRLTIMPGEQRSLNSKLYKCLQFENGQVLSVLFYVSFYPEPVSDLVVYFVGKVSISVSWKYQSNGSTPRQSVDIEFFRGNIMLMQMSRAPDLTNLTLSDLSAGNIYRLKVYVVNGFGRSASATVDAVTLNDPVPLILRTTIPLLFILILSGLVLLIVIFIFIRRWQVKERNRILSRKMEEGVPIEYEEKEYKNKFSELVAKTKKKIIGEEVYRMGPKYVTRGTDTAQDNRRESVLVQGLKFFPRRLSRVAGLDILRGDESRRRSLFTRKLSVPDDTPISLGDRQRRRSTHVRRKSMAAAAAAYGPEEGRPGDREKISGFYRRKSMAGGGKRKSIAGEVHSNKRRSITGAANWYSQRHGKPHEENNQGQVSHEHSRRRSSVHHRRKSIDDRRKSTTGDDSKDDAENVDKEHHRHHRRKSTVVDGEEGASSHRRKSTVVDGEEGAPRHRRKSTVVDGEEGASRHRRKSTVVDGEEGASRHRRKSTMVDGEEGAPRHRRKSTVVDGEEGAPRHRRKSTMVDADVKDAAENEGKEHHYRRRSQYHRRKSNVTDADLKDTDGNVGEENRPRSSPYDRKQSIQVDADVAGNVDEEHPSGRSPYDRKKSTMVDSEEWDTAQNSGELPIDPALNVKEITQDEDEQQSKHQYEGEAYDFPSRGILKTPPPDYAIYSDLNINVHKPEHGPSGVLGESSEEDTERLISSEIAKSISPSDAELPASHAGEDQ